MFSSSFICESGEQLQKMESNEKLKSLLSFRSGQGYRYVCHLERHTKSVSGDFRRQSWSWLAEIQQVKLSSLS